VSEWYRAGSHLIKNWYLQAGIWEYQNKMYSVGSWGRKVKSVTVVGVARG